MPKEANFPGIERRPEGDGKSRLGDRGGATPLSIFLHENRGGFGDSCEGRGKHRRFPLIRRCAAPSPRGRRVAEGRVRGSAVKDFRGVICGFWLVCRAPNYRRSHHKSRK